MSSSSRLMIIMMILRKKLSFWIKFFNHYIVIIIINVPTARAQAYLMDYTQGEREPTMRAQCGLVGAIDCK
jgi:hypothetical protein